MGSRDIDKFYYFLYVMVCNYDQTTKLDKFYDLKI